MQDGWRAAALSRERGPTCMNLGLVGGLNDNQDSADDGTTRLMRLTADFNDDGRIDVLQYQGMAMGSEGQTNTNATQFTIRYGADNGSLLVLRRTAGIDGFCRVVVRPRWRAGCLRAETVSSDGAGRGLAAGRRRPALRAGWLRAETGSSGGAGRGLARRLPDHLLSA